MNRGTKTRRISALAIAVVVVLAAPAASARVRRPVPPPPAPPTRERAPTDELIERATAHRLRGEYRAALACLEEYRALYRAAGVVNGQAFALWRSGWLLHQLGDVPGTLRCYEAALDAYDHLGEPTPTSDLLNQIASLEWQGPSAERAYRYFELAAAVAETHGVRPSLAQALEMLGIMSQLRGDYRGAGERLERALAMNRADGRAQATVNCLTSLGSLHMQQRRWSDALTCFEEALPLTRAHGFRHTEGNLEVNIGLVHRSQGRPDEALQGQHRGLAIFREIGARAEEGRALGNIAMIYTRRGEYARALEYSRLALKVKEEAGDLWAAAATLHGIARIYELTSRQTEALPVLLRSLAIYERLKARPRIADSFSTIANQHHQLGDYREAADFSRRALALYEELGDLAALATQHTKLGMTLHYLGEHNRARHHLERGIALAEQTGSEEILAPALLGLGSAQEQRGEYESALATYERALEHQILHPLAGLYGRWGIVRVLAATQRWPRALNLAKEVLLEAAGHAAGLGEAEGALARDRWSTLYEVGMDAAIHEDDVESLLFFVEQARAGMLREAMGSREAVRNAVTPEDLRRELDEARKRERKARKALQAAVQGGRRKEVQTARAALDVASTRVERAIEDIRRQAKTAAVLDFPRADDLEAICRSIESEEALVLYGLTSTRAFALVIRPDGARRVDLGTPDDVARALDAALLDDEPYVEPSSVPTLTARFASPLGLTEDVKRVLVSPTGRLGYLPFAPLFPTREVVHVPSGTTLGALRAMPVRTGEGVLALGDPVYDLPGRNADARRHRGILHHHLAPLPATRVEVDAIADVKLLGSSATERELIHALASREAWRAVHFACHGLVNDDRPLSSSLAISADAEHDGFLTCLEILRLHVPADLVVLSACETAKGRIYATEGVVGLTLSFFVAGAPRVICSLWNVDDDATRVLMTRFYELWCPRDGSHGLSPAAALKQAQAFVRDHPDHPEWRHPYYWAAWTLWGLGD